MAETQLTLDNVLPLDRPMGASDEDRFVGEDEFGDKIYETFMGHRYTVRPATQEERDARQPLPVQAKKWWDEGANLPSGQQVLDTLKAIPGEMVNTVDRTMKGEGTVGDFLDTAGMVAAPAAPNLVRAADADVLSALGATHRVPKYKTTKPAKVEKPVNPELTAAEKTLSDYNISKQTLIEVDPNYNSTTLYDTGEYTDNDIYDMDPQSASVVSNLSFRDVLLKDLGVKNDWGDLPEIVAQESGADFHEGSLPLIIESYANEIRKTGQYKSLLEEAQRYRNLSDDQRAELHLANQTIDEIRYENSYWNDEPFDASFNTDGVQFQDPLIEIFNEMEIPEKGIRGAQLIKDLQDNPTVRNAQLKSQGIFDQIDPQKRYTKDEIQEIFSSSAYDYRVVPYNSYSMYQRQSDLVDKEVPDSYVEFAIEANTTSPYQKSFKANSQHFSPNTLAHVRLSQHDSGNRRYVLIEELQSDLLQQGFAKPVKDWETAKKAYLARIPESDPERYHRMSKISQEDVQVYSTPIYELDKDTLLKYFGTADTDKIYETPGLANSFINTVTKKLGLDPTKGDDIDKTYSYLFELSELVPDYNNTLTVPPVAKTEETVRLGIDAAIAHAASQNLTSVVIPPFKKIVEKRFSNPTDIAKAMDPKSGFYATYVTGVNKVIKDLKAEYGDAIRVDEIDLKYDPQKSYHSFGNEDLTNVIVPETPEDMFYHPDVVQNFTLHREDRLNIDDIEKEQKLDQSVLDQINKMAPTIADSNLQLSALEAVGEKNFGLWRDFKDTMRMSFPRVNFGQALDILEAEGGNFTDILFNLAKSEKSGPKLDIEKGIEIDFENLANQGYDLTKPKFAEGGVVENVDPISGNTVPTGSLPHEVRDDVDAKLSEGEYVLPADVVRYFGLSKIENLVAQAKKGLAEMDAKGRIGGKGEDDLPFSPEELQAVEDSPAQAPQGAPQVRMAVGGVVPPAQPNTPSTPQPALPEWMLQFGQPSDIAPEPAVAAPVRAPQVSNDRSQAERDAMKPTGMAGSVDQWATKDFVNYATQRTSNVNRGINSAINTFVPMGSVFTRLRQKYLEENVPKTMEEMLAAGKDLQGNKLDEAQMQDLKTAYDKIKAQELPKNPGILGAVGSKIKDAIKGKSTTGRTETRNGVTYSGVSSRSSDSSMNSGSGPAWSSAKRTSTSMSSSPRPQARPSNMSGGGLVKKRNK